MSRRFYVYGLFKPMKEDALDECFYIGKGTGGRLNHHLSENRSRESYNKYKDEKIRETRKEGYEPYARKLLSNLTEKEALNKEKILIEEIGFDKLTNILKKGFSCGRIS